MSVRVRIAPSPTGDPHVGLAYTALFNYALAKKHGGKLILRIEDTDQARFRSSSQQQIMESLKWLGLEWDEGPDCGGGYGPYHQSERKDIHNEHVNVLMASGHAYRCFCTKDRLDEVRKLQREKKETTRYDGVCRHLSDADVEKNLSAEIPYVVRMKAPSEGVTTFEDALRGTIEIANTQMDDQVLLKSDGFPTYHLANVVDDHLMKITHVIRAEEWISSTPKHIQLYKMFGWDIPVFAHLPLLRNNDQSKISKRKNPVSLNYYRRKGVLPEAMLNFLGTMGWSFGNDVEFFSLSEMVDKFRLEDVQPGGPVFDVEKLHYFNAHYLRELSPEVFADWLREEFFSKQALMKLHPLLAERIEVGEDFIDKSQFFFNGKLSYDGVSLIPKGREKDDVVRMLTSLVEKLDELYDWDVESLQRVFDDHRADLGWKPGQYLMPLRLVVSGRKDSPPLVEMIETLGREMVRFRLRDAAQFLKTMRPS
ncbi:MAG: glutamate--tRNA ligase [Oligoflexales bacterium]